MNSDLTREDYETILKYYKIKIPTNLKKLKSLAEDVLANKLCRCIKKVKKTGFTEKNAIKICRKSVLNTKKINMFKFKCKKKARLISKKGTRKKLYKI